MTILKEIDLTLSKSSFILSLNQSEKGNLFVEIEQKNSTFETTQKLKLNKEAALAVIEILNDFRNEIIMDFELENQVPFNLHDEIKNRYLNKGLNIMTIANQYNTIETEIERILRQYDIAIVDNAMKLTSNSRFWRKKRNK